LRDGSLVIVRKNSDFASFENSLIKSIAVGGGAAAVKAKDGTLLKKQNRKIDDGHKNVSKEKSMSILSTEVVNF
jgi:hypothetical protein